MVISHFRSLGHPINITASSLWGTWETHLRTLCLTVRCCPGAQELVRLMADCGTPLAVATSCFREGMEVKIEAQPSLFEHFKMTCVVTGDDPSVKRGKPNPDIFLEAARRIGVDPAECLAFEDSLSGVRAAADAGCRVVAVPDGRDDVAEFWEAGASRVIRR